jgi:tetratricopeptide repeat protein 30
MSLLAYCYYMSQDFSNAARVYEQLVKYYPEIHDYKLYLAESHYKNGDLEEALKVSQTIQDPEYRQRLIQLQALIKYSQEEIQHAKALLRQGNLNIYSGSQDDADIIVNEGCILYKEGKYEEARVKFSEAMNTLGYNCELAYNIALCHFKMKQLAPSLSHIAEIIEKGVR